MASGNPTVDRAVGRRCWGVIPYPIIEYLGISHTTGMISLLVYYVVLAVSILVQVFIIVKSISAMRNDAKHDCIFKILQIHHTFTGIYLFTFFAVYPLIRDMRAGLNVFSPEYVFLTLIGLYGLILNLGVSLAVTRFPS